MKSFRFGKEEAITRFVGGFEIRIVVRRHGFGGKHLAPAVLFLCEATEKKTFT